MVKSSQKPQARTKAEAPPGAKERARIDLSSLGEREIAAIRDDLVKAVVERAKIAERDPHSNHGNVHSSNNSAGAI